MSTPRPNRNLLPALLALSLGTAALLPSHPAAAFEIQPEARLHLDYGAWNEDSQPLDNDFMVRKATFGLEGAFGGNWSFEIEYGFADDGKIRPADGSFRDIALKYEGWDVADITIGQFKLPFGLSEQTSSNDIMFIERALPVDAFPTSRRMGVGFSRTQDAYSISGMLFGSTVDGDDRGRGAAARFTMAPINQGGTVLHFGASAIVESPHEDVDFSARPEARPADIKLVHTRDIDHVDRIHRYGLEAAWLNGPWSIQAEWMQADLHREAGFADAGFDGWYVSTSWVLGGQSRRYDQGEFKGVEPASGGTWELTTRYSRIDLDDGLILGGQERNTTLGINYYLNEHVRFMANYIQVQSERQGIHDDPSVVLLRAQFVL